MVLSDSAEIMETVAKERLLFTTQDIFTSNEERQIVDFVARGRYPIAIGPSGTLTFQLKAQGLPVELFGSAGLQEGGFVTASNGMDT